MDRETAILRAQDRKSVEKFRLIFSVALLIFSLWQMEIILIYGQVGWPTDIFWVEVPAWIAVTYYSGLICFAWLLKPVKRINLVIAGPDPELLKTLRELSPGSANASKTELRDSISTG